MEIFLLCAHLKFYLDFLNTSVFSYLAATNKWICPDLVHTNVFSLLKQLFFLGQQFPYYLR